MAESSPRTDNQTVLQTWQQRQQQRRPNPRRHLATRPSGRRTPPSGAPRAAGPAAGDVATRGGGRDLTAGQQGARASPQSLPGVAVGSGAGERPVRRWLRLGSPLSRRAGSAGPSVVLRGADRRRLPSRRGKVPRRHPSCPAAGGSGRRAGPSLAAGPERRRRRLRSPVRLRRCGPEAAGAGAGIGALREAETGAGDAEVGAGGAGRSRRGIEPSALAAPLPRRA